MFHASKKSRSSYCCVFSIHRHQASTTVQHTPSVSSPIRHPSDKESSEQSQASKQTYIYMTNTRHQVHTNTYAVCSSVPRLWIVFLEHGGGALGIFKSPVCTYNQAWTFSLSASHNFSFLSKRSGRRMPPAERSALYNRIYLSVFRRMRLTHSAVVSEAYVKRLNLKEETTPARKD